MVTTVGKYELDHMDVDNLDEYLKRLGVGLVLRKVLTTCKPTLEITYSPDTDDWCIKTETPFKTSICRFKVGIGMEDETYDARKCMTTGEIVDGKIVLQQTCDHGPDVMVIKEKIGEDMVKVTWTADNFSAFQVYKKVT